MKTIKHKKFCHSKHNKKNLPSFFVTFPLTVYDLNRDLDPAVNIRSGSMICVQVESVRRHKTEESECKRKLPSIIKEDKENLDPQIIPNQKRKKTGKKEHNLNKNILKNQPN